MSVQVAMSNPYDVLKKAHIAIMRHRETYLYSGVLMLGESTIRNDIATAATNGRDKFYNENFIMNLTPEEVTAIVLHEGLHVFLKHMMRHTDLIAEDPRLANAAMDYVVNDIIVNLKDKALAKLPKGGLYDPKFHDWSVREIYNYLKTGTNKEGEDEGEPEETQGDDGETEIDLGGGRKTKGHAGNSGSDFSSRTHSSSVSVSARRIGSMPAASSHSTVGGFSRPRP